MVKKQKKAYSRILAFFLAAIMILAVCPWILLADETIEQGLWKITNGTSSGEAVYGDMGFVYHSPTAVLEYGSSGGKDYVKSVSTNGAATNGIVTTEGKSYCDFTSPADGTLTVYVGNASSKTGYVSKTAADGTKTAIGSFVPGADGDYDAQGFKVTQGQSWATLDIETEKGSTYYVTVAGSKMNCYGMDFVPYTIVTGKVTDPFAANEDGVIWGDVTDDGKVTATDAAALFRKMNDPSFVLPIESVTDNWQKYADVDGKDGLTNGDYEELLKKAQDGKYKLPAESSEEQTVNDQNYEVKFINKATGETKTIRFNGDTFETTLKPGEYTLSLVGDKAAKYAVSRDTRTLNVSASTSSKPLSQNVSVKLEKSIAYTLTGTISGFDAVPSDMKLTFVPSDAASYVDAPVTIDGMNYSVLLTAGAVYTLNVDGGFDYKLSEKITVSGETKDPQTKNIKFVPVDKYEVTGGFLLLGDNLGEYKDTTDVAFTEIKFTNTEDKYEYTGTVSNGKYSASLRDGSYLASITDDKYSTTTHVVVEGGKAARDILLKDNSEKAVEYKDTLYVGNDKEFKYVQAAVDYATAMTRTNGERVTIKLDPGVYREQIVVNTPNITFESNGGNRDNTKISWYYGIGYKYYSCVDSVYSPYAAYDKFEKGDAVKYWGSALITNKTAEGFRAKDITFENSFNKYITDEEMEDGAEPNGLQAITVQRKETTKVERKTATERAAAYVNYADKTEFLNCSFLGSQDTLYTCNVASDAYYKNCYIEGQTDFIYGNGDVIFDGCEINFCGYSDTQAAGYLTANSCSQQYMAEDGYIFRNCYVSYTTSNRKVAPGYLGRMWGDSAKVAFINTKLQDKDMIVGAGWQTMGSNDPTSKQITLVEYNTTYNGAKADVSSRVAGVKDTLEESKYSPKAVFVDKGWTPAYYTPEVDTVPAFKTEPAMVSNGDKNAPNPGETLTAIYELGDDWAANDASKIDWYALPSNYDFDNATLASVTSGELLKSTFVTNTVKFQIPMEAKGKYIGVVVTPITINGKSGEAKFSVNHSERPVSGDWSDPDNQGSIAPGSGINIYLAGDSTVKDYSADGIYNSGKILSAGSWGEYLRYFFNTDYVTVNNYAQGGRSLRSFLNEGKLDEIIKNIKEGDYLLIQFGHNDCANGVDYYQERFVPLYTPSEATATRNKSSNFSTVKPTESMKTATPDALKGQYGATYYAWDCGATYKGFIQEYIDRALEKGAIPVVVTPVARLYYSGGKIRTHHDATMTDYAATLNYTTENDAYVTACKEVYEANKSKGVLLLDAFAITKKMYEDAYAACGSDAYGAAVMDKTTEKLDATHSNKTGGVIQAGYIAEYFKNAGLSVSEYVVQPKKVYGEETNGEYIFTIDKNGVFEGKDKSYTVNAYWTKLGQELFDSLGKPNGQIQNQ